MQYERVLLTGATSFLGRRLMGRLLEDGHHVVATSSQASSEATRPRVTWVRANFTEPDSHTPIFWKRIIKLHGVTMLINNAGITSEQPHREITFYNINVKPVRAMLMAARALGLKPFIQISSSVATLRHAEKFGYASSKKMGEDIVVGEGGRLDWTIIRAGLIFDENGFSHPMAFDEIAALPFLTPIVGDGEQRLQPVFIGDIAKLISRLVAVPAHHRIIDAVGSESMTVKEILHTIKATRGEAFRPFHIPLPLALAHARHFPYGQANVASWTC